MIVAQLAVRPMTVSPILTELASLSDLNRNGRATTALRRHFLQAADVELIELGRGLGT